MEDNSKPHSDQGLMALVLDGMPAWVRATVFTFLAIPLVVAISAMMLGVNVGEISNRYVDLDLKRVEHELRIEQSQTSVLEDISRRLSVLENNAVPASILSGYNDNLKAVKAHIKSLTQWVCKHGAADEGLSVCQSNAD